MNPNVKLLIGGVATAVLGLGFHAWANYGPGYIAHLGQGAAAALSAAPGVTATFQKGPLQSVAVLSGPVSDPAERAKLVAAVKAVPGVHDASWSNIAAPAEAAAPLPAPATPEAVKNCQADVDSVVKGKTIEFASGSAKLTDTGQALVDVLATKFAPCAGTKITIDGYTDATGNAVKNQALSVDRADAVAKALVAKGVAEARLVTKGFGSTKPIAECVSPQANAQNRRIEFIVSSAS